MKKQTRSLPELWAQTLTPGVTISTDDLDHLKQPANQYKELQEPWRVVMSCHGRHTLFARTRTGLYVQELLQDCQNFVEAPRKLFRTHNLVLGQQMKRIVAEALKVREVEMFKLSSIAHLQPSQTAHPAKAA